MDYSTTNTQTSESWRIRSYCSICANSRSLEDLKTSHNTKQHDDYFDTLGDQ